MEMIWKRYYYDGPPIDSGRSQKERDRICEENKLLDAQLTDWPDPDEEQTAHKKKK
jgi:hypothetical protein